MVKLSDKFKTSEHEPVAFDFSIPDGDYLAAVTKSGEKISNKTGKPYLNFGFQILDGAKKNLYVWDNFHIAHPDPDTQRISWGRLTSLCQAAGIDEMEETEELHDIPVYITVKNKGDNVNITNFKPEKGKMNRNKVVDKSAIANRLGTTQPPSTSAADQAKLEQQAKDFNEDKLPF